MRNKVLVAGAGVALLALTVWWFTSRPQLIIALETDDGKNSLIYQCTIISDAVEAQTRANAAHVALQAGANIIGTDAGTEMHAAMQAANVSGDIPDLGAIDAKTRARERALEAEIKHEFGCNVDI